MSSPFIGEIRMFAGNFAPVGWAFCNGALMPIDQNDALFNLIGTTYGGDGRVNFGLPDLRARVPIHMGEGHTLGEKGGEQAHTLSISEIPTHTHVLSGTSTNGTSPIPPGNLMAPTPSQAYHAPDNALSAFAPQAVSNTGGSQAHLNMQPFLTLTFCIALQGIFPSQN